MVLLHTPAIEKSFIAPDFTLEDVSGKRLSFDDVRGEQGTVIAFICNHCPYVKAIIERFVLDAKALQDAGIGVAAIMPNDVVNYPADSFENMQIFAQDHGFTFSYLLDETQAVAKAYDAICTPDIFGFDSEGVLKYRGRLDSAGPNAADADTVKELVNAMLEIAGGGEISAPQVSSMGCSIKWK